MHLVQRRLYVRGDFTRGGEGERTPSLRALLEPAAQRPATFFRGYDVFDPKDVGFVSDVGKEGDRAYFAFDTALPGNGNFGHEGKAYGTELSADDKQALIEYLKTF